MEIKDGRHAVQVICPHCKGSMYSTVAEAQNLLNDHMETCPDRPTVKPIKTLIKNPLLAVMFERAIQIETLTAALKNEILRLDQGQI